MEQSKSRGVWSRYNIIPLIAVLFSLSAFAGTNIDNVRINGNSIYTLNTNGNLTFDLNGSGAIILTDLTATTVPYLDASKKLTSSAATPTQLGYLANSSANLCGISQSCTLTNKTISGSDNTISNINLGSQVTSTLPVANGGTGESSYTDGQLLIGNTSGNTLTKASLTAGSNITITPGGGSITIAASSSASPAYTYVSQTSTLNPAVLSNSYNLSGASFNITLPDATAGGAAGKDIVFKHYGTSLTQVYCFLTTSSQTINGPGGTVASGNYCMYTNGERLVLEDDGANWQVKVHDTVSAEVDAGALVVSASSAHSFTISSASITAGTTYSTPNGCRFIVSTTTSSSTNLLAYGTCNPDAASNTLTYVSGPTAGDRAYTVVSNAGKPVYLTTSFNRFIWYRTGSYVNFRWEAAGTTAGTAGTGDHLFFLPDNLSPDSTNMVAQTAILAGAYVTSFSNLGSGQCFGSSVVSFCNAHLAWPGTFKGTSVGYGQWSASAYSMMAANSRWSLLGRYKVTGWQP